MPDRLALDFEKPIIELEKKIDEMKALSGSSKIELDDEIARLEKKAEKLRKDVFSSLNRWQRVQLARHPDRPYSLDYISRIFTDFIELHGDRAFSDDPAIICGLGRLEETSVMIIGHQKGRGTKDNLYRNFGMPHPEGYRKAKRLMELAARFGRPVISLIDTPGAYPGLGAEERGQAEAIASNLMVMANLPVPFIAVVIGEGGSGGALAIGIADRVFMLENSIYSVISPEGCASILYRDSSQAHKAAEAMKVTASDLQKLGLINGVIKEPPGGAHRYPDICADNIREILSEGLNELSSLPVDELIAKRHERYYKMGKWEQAKE
ncbi:acetyl-CoA carboxylase carboxyl transferase subunit alpha [candidate division LCP-89 bacterium B3_LCP]|uniref:Acetyl-coenzyme A carboxylase carboxyl transferase subunit alpha n=1 Tax=candidate division LCP-89 bacterium B3_LCP TaxID=2012998 RepID=A0A532UU02_UNCL8|nr:MAG: acetyl-CoA carboxylase carboxyl transferase subunit alpha [candidate division LCP-89 bacterium B3_LCP]